jgi:hypothetical protein
MMTRREVIKGYCCRIEYAGVHHNIWQWAFTESAVLKWTFARARS